MPKLHPPLKSKDSAGFVQTGWTVGQLPQKSRVTRKKTLAPAGPTQAWIFTFSFLHGIKHVYQVIKYLLLRFLLGQNLFCKFQQIRYIHIFVHIFSKAVIAFYSLCSYDIIWISVGIYVISPMSERSNSQIWLSLSTFSKISPCIYLSEFFRK